MNEIMRNLAISLPGFLLAITCHEAAHAIVALKFGDDTAHQQGRISLNPIDHIDIIGTVIFPLVGILMGGVPFGWAKPVQSNPSRFHNIRWGIFWVSFAGPLSNLVLAFISALVFGLIYAYVPADFSLFNLMILITKQSVLINIVLGAFNLIPFPPLDGAKMLSTFLPYEQARKFEELQRFSFLFIILLWTTPVFNYFLFPFLMFGQGMLRMFVDLLR